MNLITGYKGYKHVKSEDVAAFNRMLYGPGAYVLNAGSCFAAELSDTNVVRIHDGELMICGYHARTEPGNYDDVTLTPGTAGTYRHDYIVAQYEKKSDGTEEVTLLDLTGTEASSANAAALPSLVQNDLLNYGTIYQVPLYTVLFSGLSAGEPVQVFSAIDNLHDLLNATKSNLQAQINGKQATITGAASSVASSNLTGSRALIANSSGKIAVSSATEKELGYLSGLKSNAQNQLNSIVTALQGFGVHYMSASDANVPSNWSWQNKKFDTASAINDSGGNLTSKVASGLWVPPSSGFIVASVQVRFGTNTNGSRGVRLVIYNKNGELVTGIATVIDRAATHTNFITATAPAYITADQRFGLQVAQDCGSALAVKAICRVLFLPNV